MEALQDVEEAVEEERIVLDELVVLRQLARHQQPQLRVDRRQPLDLAAAGRRQRRHRRPDWSGLEEPEEGTRRLLEAGDEDGQAWVGGGVERDWGRCVVVLRRGCDSSCRVFIEGG